MTNPDDKILQALEKIRQCRRALKPGQGRVARRNARTAIFGAIKSLEMAIDKEFPLAPKARSLPMDLAARAERVGLETMRGLVRERLPHEWNRVHAQAIVNSVMDLVSQNARVVIEVEASTKMKYATLLEGVIQVPIRLEANETWLKMFMRLAYEIVYRKQDKATERALCRALAQITAIYEDLKTSGELGRLSA